MTIPSITRAEHRIACALRDAGATSPEGARPVAPARRVDGRALDRLLATGMAREAGPGRYWLDVAGYEAYRRELRTRGVVAVGTAVVMVLLIALCDILGWL